MLKISHQRPRKGKSVLVFGLMLFSGVWGGGQEPITTLNDLYQHPAFPQQEQKTQQSTAETVQPSSGEQSELESLRTITVDDLLSSRKLAWQISGGTAWNYNSNIFSSNIPVSDQILVMNCGMALSYGAEGAPLNIAANYGLSYSQYQKFSQNNGYGQAAGLNATWLPGERTSVTGALSSSGGAGSSIGSSVQTKSDNLSASLGLRYKMTEKVSSGCDFGYTMKSNGSNQTYDDKNVNLVNDYRLTSKVQIGIGIGAGMRTTNGAEDETDQSARLRWSYDITGKMKFSGDAGMEDRMNSSGQGSWQPRFQGGWQYNPFDGTSLNISGYRRVDASYSGTVLDVGQTLGCNATLSQRLFQRLFLGISGGVENVQRDTGNASSSNGGQNRSYIGASFSRTLLRWIDGSVYYRFTSTHGVQSYNQTTLGVQLSAHY